MSGAHQPSADRAGGPSDLSLASESQPKALIPCADDYEPEYGDDYDLGDCSNCGGEGFTYGCSWDWQCDTWDGDSCLCTRPCEWCQPRRPDPALQQVLAEALAACLAPGCERPRGSICTRTLCHGRGYGQHLYAKGIEAGTDETPQAAQPEGQEPGAGGIRP